ncbi:MAG: hypothetical protein QOE90_2928 [Thermoplasmata archaeon]|jgi:hypothetical protein|nr:hypothetical protein [Thermoplasmata archaeon]
MSRRRPSFATYARRRWRVLGLLLVLLAGSVLILAITDKGHDPAWEARGASMEQGAISPAGDAAYALVREGGNITRLEARRGDDGHLLWSSPLNATRAVMAAGDDGVAVATDFPLSFLTFYAKDGSVRDQIFLEGVPRALAVEGSRVALALQAPDNPVLVVSGGRVEAVHRFASFVNALDMRGGRVAAGTGAGEVRIEDALSGAVLYDGSFSLSIHSLRLAADGGSLVFGGASLEPGNLTGEVGFVDLLGDAPVRWTHATAAGTAFVDLDRSGVWALAVEDGPAGNVVRVYAAATGETRWSRDVQGGLAQGDANEGGGVSLSADGAFVAVGTLHGGISVYRTLDGARLWTYRDDDTTRVRFAEQQPDALLANGKRNAGDATVGLLDFSVAREPLPRQLPALAALLALGFAAAGALILGVGYWRLRRSY